MDSFERRRAGRCERYRREWFHPVALWARQAPYKSARCKRAARKSPRSSRRRRLLRRGRCGSSLAPGAEPLRRANTARDAHTHAHTHVTARERLRRTLARGARTRRPHGGSALRARCTLRRGCAAAPLRRPYARCSERIAALAGMTHPPDIRTDSKAPPERRARRHSAARQPCRVAGGKQSLRGRGRAGHRAGYRA